MHRGQDSGQKFNQVIIVFMRSYQAEDNTKCLLDPSTCSTYLEPASWSICHASILLSGNFYERSPSPLLLRMECNQN